MGQPGSQILKPGPNPAQTMPGPTRTQPNSIIPEPPETAQTIPVQGLIQFYLKMLLHLNLAETFELSCF